jgi:hypothetical protein
LLTAIIRRHNIPSIHSKQEKSLRAILRNYLSIADPFQSNGPPKTCNRISVCNVR